MIGILHEEMADWEPQKYERGGLYRGVGPAAPAFFAALSLL